MDEQVCSHFKKVDPILYALIEKVKIEELTPRPPELFFHNLCETIVIQQLSGKAGSTIFNRFQDLFTKEVNPKELLKIPSEKIRAVGTSNSKVKFLKDLASKVAGKDLILEELPKLNNEEVITRLTKVYGIGRWSAEMFLMFSLGRGDTFSHGDLGLKRAIEKHYNLKDPTREQVEMVSVKWSPYRTYACQILWKSLENSTP